MGKGWMWKDPPLLFKIKFTLSLSLSLLSSLLFSLLLSHSLICFLCPTFLVIHYIGCWTWTEISVSGMINFLKQLFSPDWWSGLCTGRQTAGEDQQQVQTAGQWLEGCGQPWCSGADRPDRVQPSAGSHTKFSDDGGGEHWPKAVPVDPAFCGCHPWNAHCEFTPCDGG